MIVHSAGNRITPGTYKVLSRHPHAVNYTGADRSMVFAVMPRKGAGPLNLVVDQPSELPDQLCLTEEDLAPTYNGTLQACEPEQFPTLGKSLITFRHHLLREAWPDSLIFLLQPAAPSDKATFRTVYQDHMRMAYQALCRGKRLQAVTDMRGCGTGLTPAGDDFIAGLLFTAHLLPHGYFAEEKNEILEAARGTNPLSNTFLQLACEGMAFETLHALAQALVNGRGIRPAVSALLKHGSNSGADLAVGFLTGLELDLETISPSTFNRTEQLL